EAARPRAPHHHDRHRTRLRRGGRAAPPCAMEREGGHRHAEGGTDPRAGARPAAPRARFRARRDRRGRRRTLEGIAPPRLVGRRRAGRTVIRPSKLGPYTALPRSPWFRFLAAA